MYAVCSVLHHPLPQRHQGHQDKPKAITHTTTTKAMKHTNKHKPPPTLEQALEQAMKVELKALARDARKANPITAQA